MDIGLEVGEKSAKLHRSMIHRGGCVSHRDIEMPKPAGITQVGVERDVDLSLFRESFDLRGELFAGYRPVGSRSQDRTPVIRVTSCTC